MHQWQGGALPSEQTILAPLGSTTTPGWLGAEEPPPRLELQAASESSAT